MNGARLQQIYELQLAEAIERRDEKGFDLPGFRLLLSVGHARGGADLVPGKGRTWIWSDLHLGDQDALDFFGRPFTSVEAMTEAISKHWREAVDPGDTIVCLGDATKGQTDGPGINALRAMPGRKILVFGNHDRSPRNFDEVRGSLYSHGDPPLVLTHVPMRRVPPNA